MFGFTGSIASVATARFAIKSSTGCHETPLSMVFQIPPETLPTHMVAGVVG
jgi:hypothetical protein